MPEERSLDDFVGADASDDDEVADGATDESPEEVADESPEEVADGATDEVVDEATDEVAAESTEEVDDESVEPPSITATWVTDGIACERCDAVVERRWKCDGDYVCADCKDW